MSRHLFVLSVLSLFCCFAHGQATTSLIISGQVVGEKGEGLPYATVALTEIPFTIIKGVVTDEQGKFKLVGVRGNYTLRIRMLGYSFWTKRITEQDSILNIGTVKLKVKEEQLGMVTVQPLVEQKVDEICYNLKADPDREKLNLHEILGKVPLIRHTPLGDLYVDVPDKKFLVLRNGKRDALFSGKNLDEILKAMPAKGYSAVRVKLKPSEKYEGFDYVIDIETDQTTRLVGLVGLVNGKGEWKQGAGNGEISLGGSSEKLRYMFGVRGESYRTPVYHQISQQHYLAEDNVVYRESRRKTSGENGGIGGELSYDLSKKHFVNLKVQGDKFFSRNETSIHEHTFVDKSRLFTGRKSWTNYSDIQIAANYQWDIKPGGTTLNIVGQYNQRPKQLRNGEREEESVSYYLPYSETEDGEKQYALQVHYVNPLSQKFNLQVGGGYIYRHYESEYRLENQGIQSLMHMTHQLYSSYFKLAYRIKSFRIAVGTKLDYLNDGEGIYQGAGKNEQWITETPFHCLPNAEISFFLPKKKLSRLDVNYVMNKTRPGLALLSTRIDDSNADYIRQNNMSLKSETTHRLGINISLFNVRLLLSGIYRPDGIHSYWHETDAGQLVKTYANDSENYSFSGQLSDYLIRKSFTCHFMLNTQYSYRQVAEEKVKNWLSYLTVMPAYTFKNKLALGATASYVYTVYSGMEGQKNRRPFSLGLNARKKFLKQDQLEISLTCRNILYLKSKNVYEVNTAYQQLRQEVWQRYYPLEFKFSWRIGSFQVKPVRKGSRGIIIDDVKMEE